MKTTVPTYIMFFVAVVCAVMLFLLFAEPAPAAELRIPKPKDIRSSEISFSFSARPPAGWTAISPEYCERVYGRPKGRGALPNCYAKISTYPHEVDKPAKVNSEPAPVHPTATHPAGTP